jgi:hypothetical protein
MIPEKYLDGARVDPRYASFLEDLAKKQAEAMINVCAMDEFECPFCGAGVAEECKPDCPVLQSEAQKRATSKTIGYVQRVCSCKKPRPEVLITTVTMTTSAAPKPKVTKLRNTFCKKCHFPVWKTTAKFPSTIGTTTTTTTLDIEGESP